MKKFIMMMVVAFAAVITMNAKDYKDVAPTSRFTDNWSVGLNGGVQTNLHDWNAPQGGLFGVELNKDITSLFGVSAEVGLGFNNNADWMCDKLYTTTRHNALSHGGTAIENLYTFADGRFNLTNAIWGYNGTPRLFEVEANVGVGYGHAYNNNGDGNDALLSKAGIRANFNLGKDKAWTVSVRPAVIWNTSATGNYDSRHGVGELTCGVAYHFKNRSNKKHYMDAYVPEIVEKVVTKEVVKEVTKVKEIVKEVIVPTTPDNYVVTFAFDSASLTPEATAILDGIEKDAVVVVDGYASSENKKSQDTHNTALSAARAKVVADYLDTRGVKVKEVNHHGATGNFGRVTIVTLSK